MHVGDSSRQSYEHHAFSMYLELMCRRQAHTGTQSVVHTLLIRVAAGETINWRKLYIHMDLKASCEALFHEHVARVLVVLMTTEQA